MSMDPVVMSTLAKLRGGLVVSCQPVENGPMDRQDIIVAMAQAAEVAGAAGLRIQGAENVHAVKAQSRLPVIGIVKRVSPDTPIVITSTRDDAQTLVEAGADIIGLDATDRVRPEPLNDIIAHVLQQHRGIMADCATLDDARLAVRLGASIVGSTLSGYTAETMDSGVEPDFELIGRLRTLVEGSSVLVMAEGRCNTPQMAARAIRAGADAVTVGSAITRLEYVVGWFDEAIRAARRESE